jgi:hypothetical protein
MGPWGLPWITFLSIVLHFAAIPVVIILYLSGYFDRRTRDDEDIMAKGGSK